MNLYFSTIPETLLDIIIKSESQEKRKEVGNRLLDIIYNLQREQLKDKQKTTADKLRELAETVEDMEGELESFNN